MKQTIYYTVLIHRTFSMIKYAVQPECKILTFPGMFDDPGEASQQFKKAVQGNLEFLTDGAFQRKVGTQASRYQQDLARLADWKSGKGVQA